MLAVVLGRVCVADERGVVAAHDRAVQGRADALVGLGAGDHQPADAALGEAVLEVGVVERVTVALLHGGLGVLLRQLGDVMANLRDLVLLDLSNLGVATDTCPGRRLLDEVVAVDRAEFESHVVERTVLGGHEGKSGAALERAAMDDGRRLVVKRLSPATDLVMALSGDDVGREYLLWSAGVLDRLPDGVGHAVVGGWVESDATVLVMRDLGSAVLTWAHRLDDESCRWMLERVARLHDAFVGIEPADLPTGAVAPLTDLLGLFAPSRLVAHAGGPNPLADIALHGWDVFFDVVPPDVADPVQDLLDDLTPLATSLAGCPCTLTHGDLATVNMALEPDTLTLLDWSLPAVAPGVVDIARFVSGCSSVVDLSREEIIETYRAACRSSYDEHAMRLGLLTGLVWLGWNKAMDSVEHPDPETRAREGEDLDWWVAQARVALDDGLA